MGQTGGKAAGGGPDTPWTVDHSAADFNLLNLRHLGSDMIDALPSYINVVPNMTVAPNIAGRGSDLYGVLSITTVAGFAGAAADTKLFEVQLNTTHTASQALAFMNPASVTAVAAQFYSLFGSVGFGFGSFSVFNHVALAAGAQQWIVAYFCPGA